MGPKIAALGKITGETEEEQAVFFRRLMGEDSKDEIDRMLDDILLPIGKPKSLKDRQADLRAVHAKLDLRRQLVPAHKPEPVAEYQRQLARYNRAVKALAQDAAAERAKGKRP